MFKHYIGQIWAEKFEVNLRLKIWLHMCPSKNAVSKFKQSSEPKTDTKHSSDVGTCKNVLTLNFPKSNRDFWN